MTHLESNEIKKVDDDATRISLSTEFPQGQIIGGRYQVISRLGTGGMGLVYRVNQVLLNKEFALKTIDKHRMSENAIRRFQQEARRVSFWTRPKSQSMALGRYAETAKTIKRYLSKIALILDKKSFNSCGSNSPRLFS